MSFTQAQLVTPASAESLQALNLCAAMEARLENEGQAELDYDGLEDCILMEQVLLLSTEFPQTVSNFREHMGEDTYPVSLYFAFKASNDGRVIEAFSQADMALQNAIQFFTRSKDHQRGEVYVSLISDWRNNSLLPVIEGEDNRSQFANIYEKRYAKHITIPAESKLMLKCLIMNDPLIGNLAKVVNSPRLTACLESRMGH
ncbi:hypothetical protein [Shimia sediminis]|uniref:hypothetical protein n=1 Tax=Shimia sediminis TaxID=2497945 RepID=UPI000F8EC448|nr:hypothetical protein [Shimia sediminis]